MDTAFTAAPLASYLAAVGLLKVVGEQLDPEAVGSWKGGRFSLETSFSIQAISFFLANGYRPSPCFTPWNKDSGFLDGKPAPEFQQLEAARFDEIRRIVQAAAVLVPQFVSKGKLEKEAKVELVEALDRAGDSDAWSAWLGICAITFRNQKGDQVIPCSARRHRRCLWQGRLRREVCEGSSGGHPRAFHGGDPRLRSA